MTEGQRMKRGVPQRVVPPPQMPGSVGKEGVMMGAFEWEEGLLVPHGPQLLAPTHPPLLFTELLAAKKTHTCE